MVSERAVGVVKRIVMTSGTLTSWKKKIYVYIQIIILKCDYGIMRFYCMKKLYFYPCLQLKHFVIIPVLIFRTAALRSFRKKYYMLAVICWFRNTISHMLIKLPGHITQNIHFRESHCVSRWIPTDQSLNLSERPTVHS